MRLHDSAAFIALPAVAVSPSDTAHQFHITRTYSYRIGPAASSLVLHT